ncbi:MAG: T9SS type A sorting domain-containing protein [Bacteroidetes bacterium]|nr:T9SS type A sorting domain-containing protein [Bacteroidota bacterium]
MQPIGSMAPVGPDYGCLTLFTRPFWGYLISCDTTTTSLIFNLDSTDTNVDEEMSMVIWGPFTNKDSVCNNLTASNIYACVDRIIPTAGNYFWFGAVYALPGEFFYYMISTTDSIPNNTMSSFHGIFQPNQGNPYDCFDCNGEVSIMYKKEICMVAFDSTTQKTKIVWEKNVNSGIDGYIIYRKDLGSAFYDSAGYSSAINPGEFIDYGSSPLQFAEQYKVVPVDSCGNSYILNVYQAHNACFLQTFPSGNNTVNLNWNQFATNWNLYEPFQYLYRGGSPQTMQVFDTIPFGVLSYTDIAAPPGVQYYAVEKRKLLACDPLRISSGTGNYGVRSNPSSSTVTGIANPVESDFISISPQPAYSQLKITFKNSVTGSNMKLIDVTGKEVVSKIIQNSTEILEIGFLPDGIYFLSITGSVNFTKKVVKTSRER